MASPGVAGDARASSHGWIPRLVFSSVSFFPQCVTAVHSPPQLSPVLAERGGGAFLRGLAGQWAMLARAEAGAPPGGPGTGVP